MLTICSAPYHSPLHLTIRPAGGALTLMFVNLKDMEHDITRVELPERDFPSLSDGPITVISNGNVGNYANGSNGTNGQKLDDAVVLRERTPLAATEHKTSSNKGKKAKGQYTMVGSVDGAHHGTFAAQESGRRPNGGFLREGNADYLSLSRGRGGGVEGEAQGGVRSGDVCSDDDSDSDDGGIVVVDGTKMAMV